MTPGVIPARPAVPFTGASLPPGPYPDLDPAWSRWVTAPDARGVPRRWHLLDNGAAAEHGTLLCVHGNPTWSYLWRRVIAAAPAGWRVVAVDQLGMGWSERTGPRSLAERIDDLGSLTVALGISGPVVTLAHDWGGPVCLGWALAHRSQLAAVVLTNTAVHQPPAAAAPALIRMARLPGVRQAVCVATPTFVRATTALSRSPLPRDVRNAFAAPYPSPAVRHAIGDFVADIPLDPSHPSAGVLDALAHDVSGLEVPVLLLWGPRDPVFSDVYLRDLRARMPHADVHRYEGASHLVVEDAPRLATDVWCWVRDQGESGTASPPPDLAAQLPVDIDATTSSEAAGGDAVSDTGVGEPIWAALTAHAGDPSAAIAEGDAGGRRVSFERLEATTRDLAAGLAATGVRPGHRVALIVPPGADLTAAVYACWRAGASVVMADAGLGAVRMGRALRGAAPDHVIGIARGLLLARAMGVPGRRVAAGRLDRATRAAVAARYGLADLVRLGRGHELPAPPGDEAECAVVFTSGATGPPKGVVYRHEQVRAQLIAVRAAYGLTSDDRLVAAFAPFALYGPALGLASAVPDMDVTSPGTLTAPALADAVSAVDGTVVFASPAALRNVVATASRLTVEHRRALDGVRLLMSAGAPVPVSLLLEVSALLPHADVHTPYGMTEALPVTDIALAELTAVGPGEGVCVGRPLPGVTVAVSPFAEDGNVEAEPTAVAGPSGEVLVRAAHVKDRYDQLWATERESSRTTGWHRTGDVGHLDADGRLWIEGRLAHVVRTASGPVTPVGPEQRVEALTGVSMAALVGVGPSGTEQVVIVVVPAGRVRRNGLADHDLAARVREVAGVTVAAVLVTKALPVDIRHASKIDRARVGRWAATVLRGHRVGRP